MINNILALGDSHGNTKFVLEAIQAANWYNCEVILQVGDFGIWDHTQAGVKFLDDVNTELEDSGIYLVFCDGNHENMDSLYSIPIDEDGFRRVRKNIWHAPRGHIWTWNDVTFMAMGGAHSIDGPGGIWQQARGPGNGWWPEETIKTLEVLRAIDNIKNYPHPIDVMITHDCPYGVNIPGIGGYPAGNENRILLSQVCSEADPKYIYCGHYHLRHTDKFKNATVEILAADVNDREQALAVSLDTFKE